MKLAVLSTGRQDWGILRSTCALLRKDPRFNLRLILGGMQTSKQFGLTHKLVEEEGFAPSALLEWADLPSAHAQSAEATRTVGQQLEKDPVEALVLLGDRFETAAAALAATLARTPIVHLHGGEETEGAIDNALRHAITKLSHLHLTSHEEHRRRVIALGEDPATVHVVGAPGLDNVHRADLALREELEKFLEISLQTPVVLVTLHPTTLGTSSAGAEVRALIAAMDSVDATYVVTLPNTDPGHEEIRLALIAACKGPRRRAVDALGDRRYWGMLKIADAMLGNSSSALLEAAVLGLPAVNLGDRQKGRLRGDNVLDAPFRPEDITAVLRKALSSEFRASRTKASPFGDGHAAEKIVPLLAQWKPPQPPVKRGVA